MNIKMFGMFLVTEHNFLVKEKQVIQEMHRLLAYSCVARPIYVLAAY